MAGLVGSVTGAPQMKVYEPAEPIPTDAPLPPKRTADKDSAFKTASVRPDDQAQ